ncbi:MAG TPA: hypothetical protein VEJ63_17090 [Planctomycetota bacterium]|nr:hypothetical protein [Planctomycetota bacterium]
MSSAGGRYVRPDASVSPLAQERTNADDGGFRGDAGASSLALMALIDGEIAEADARR